MTQTTEIQKLAEPVHLTITRNAKGKVQYEISIHGPDEATVEHQTAELEDWVHRKYEGHLAGDEVTA